MKITKLTFLRQNNGLGNGGDKPVFQVVGGMPQSSLLGKTLQRCIKISESILEWQKTSLKGLGGGEGGGGFSLLRKGLV